MLKKVLLLAAVALVALPTTAAAQDYAPGGNTITADDTTVAPGEAIVLGIQICQPSTSATFELDSTTSLGSATAGSNGRATLTATIPSTTSAGTHTIEGSCMGSNGQPLVQVLSITVGAGGSGIPVTGSSSTLPMTQLAIAAIAGGGLLVLVANRRRTAQADARETADV